MVFGASLSGLFSSDGPPKTWRAGFVSFFEHHITQVIRFESPLQSVLFFIPAFLNLSHNL
jgi:hypothetical protein